MAEGHSPLNQFEIKRLIELDIGGIDASFTNSSLFMMLSVITISIFLILGMRNHTMIPGRWQSMVELSYVFIANLLRDTVGTAGRVYFPFIFSIFMFVLIGNLWGMIPYSFTFTSHIIVTLSAIMKYKEYYDCIYYYSSHTLILKYKGFCMYVCTIENRNWPIGDEMLCLAS